MLIKFSCLFCIKKLSVDLQFKRQVKTLPCTVTLGLELVSAGASLSTQRDQIRGVQLPRYGAVEFFLILTAIFQGLVLEIHPY